MTEEDVLGMCKTYFPGVDWEINPDWTHVKAIAEFRAFGIDFEIRVGYGDYLVYGYAEDEELFKFRGTLSEALRAAAIKWREFATEAMAVVGPLPEPAEEDLMERDEFWVGFYLEGERRRDLGEPFDIKAQIEAGEKAVKEMLEE